MPDVFISYARENSVFARQLVDALESTGRESWIDLWRVDTAEELVTWTEANRAVPTLTCEQRQTYNLPPLGEGRAGGVIPLTPFPTNTIPVWTPIASPTASETPTPSVTPTATPAS